MHRAPDASRIEPDQIRPTPQSSPGRLASSEKQNCSGKRILPKRLANQRDQAVGTTSEVDWLGCHHHPPPCRDRDHVAAITARRTSRSQTTLIPGSASTNAPQTSITIDPRLAVPTAAPGSPLAVTTGTNVGIAVSAGNASRPLRAALRHANRCCGAISCRRATSETTASGA
jgi:hypothetical protein